jgi:hypothetical protein
VLTVALPVFVTRILGECPAGALEVNLALSPVSAQPSSRQTWALASSAKRSWADARELTETFS